jgi:uncharacterized membrane protein
MPKSPEPDSLNVPVRQLVADGLRSRRLSGTEADAVLRSEGVLPDAPQWREFLRRLFMYTGALACAIGVVFFFAFNWQELPRFAKFALLQGGVLIAAAYAWRRGPGQLAGQAALLGAMLLCGALLAYLGQTYQTGADTFQLFLAWAVLILPWVVAAHLGAAWALWLVLVNLAVLLYFGRASSEPLDLFLEVYGGHLALFWLNLVVLLVAEWTLRASAARLFPRFAGVLVLACAGPGLIGFIVDGDAGGHGWLLSVSRFAMLAAIVGFLLFYRRRRDMVMLAATLFAAIIISTCVLWRIFFDHIDLDESGGILMLGLFLIGSSAAAAAWLRATQRQWQQGALS